MTLPLRFLIFGTCLLTITNAVIAGPRVDVVIGPTAPKLERFAAEELAGQFKKLFDADVVIGEKRSADATHVILLGSPDTNPVVKELGDVFPKLTDQGHVLRSVKSAKVPTLLVGGGSPVATLWAVYELGHHFGIRSMLFGDMFPVVPPELKLDGIDTLLEPSLRLRAWQTLGTSPIGPESWGLEEHQRVIRQLAKLKFNRVIIAVEPWQPFVDFEFKDARRNSRAIHKQTAVLWKGKTFPVDGDTAGRAAFRGMKYFENPDFAGKTTYQQSIDAGVKLVRGIVNTVHDVGMTAGLEMTPIKFPKEFGPALPSAEEIDDLSIWPGKSQTEDYPELVTLSKAQIGAYLKTYPNLHVLYFTLPFLQSWHKTYESAWNQLSNRTGIGTIVTLERLISEAKKQSLVSLENLEGNLVCLEFIHKLVTDRELLKLPGGNTAEPIISGFFHESILPVLPKVLPSQTSNWYFPMEQDGVLPRMSYDKLHPTLEELRIRGRDGFTLSFNSCGDTQCAVYFLSRAAFDSGMTPERACAEMLNSVCGEDVTERVIRAFSLVEGAIEVMRKFNIAIDVIPNLIPFENYEYKTPTSIIPGIPLSTVVTELSSPDEPQWSKQAREGYLNAMSEMYRANARAREGGRAFTLYFARRFEFAFEYMNCVEATRKAGIAKAKGDKATQIAELEKAIESVHAACNAMAAVARSNSDRGIIAVMNEYAYRPLKRELEEAEKK